MSFEMIWESFDAIFKVVHRQGRRVEELESRVADLERRLSERAKPVAEEPPPFAVEEVSPHRRLAIVSCDCLASEEEKGK